MSKIGCKYTLYCNASGMKIELVNINTFFFTIIYPNKIQKCEYKIVLQIEIISENIVSMPSTLNIMKQWPDPTVALYKIDSLPLQKHSHNISQDTMVIPLTIRRSSRGGGDRKDCSQYSWGWGVGWGKTVHRWSNFPLNRRRANSKSLHASIKQLDPRSVVMLQNIEFTFTFSMEHQQEV